MRKPEIPFETERLFVRSVGETDKEQYMEIRITSSEAAAVYGAFPEARDIEWERELNSPDSIYVAALNKEKQIMAAIGSFQHFDTDVIEFGIDVAKQYRNQGIATELVRGMLRIVHSEFPGKAAVIRTNVENNACRRVAEKCGGVLSEYVPSLAAKIIEVWESKYGKESAA